MDLLDTSQANLMTSLNPPFVDATCELGRSAESLQTLKGILGHSEGAWSSKRRKLLWLPTCIKGLKHYWKESTALTGITYPLIKVQTSRRIHTKFLEEPEEGYLSVAEGVFNCHNKRSCKRNPHLKSAFAKKNP